MKTATIVILAVLVVVFGGGFLIGTALWIGQMKRDAGVEDDLARVTVAVAAMDMPEGTAIVDPNTMLLFKQYPKDLAPADYIDNPNGLAGMVARRNINKGEPITLKMLRRPPQGK